MNSMPMLRTFISPAVGLGLVLAGLPAAVLAAPLGVTGAHALAAEPDLRAQKLYQSGLEHFEAGRFERAATAFEEAFELTGDPTLLYNVSIAYEKAGRLDDALVALEQYAKLAPVSEHADLERQRQELVVRIERAAREPDEPAEPAEPTTTEPPPARRQKSTDDDPPRPRVVTPLVGAMMGVTVVALGVGVGLAVPAAQANGQVEDECVPREGAYLCQGESAPLFDRRRGLAIGADVSFGIAIAAGVATITLLSLNAVRVRRSKQEAVTALAPVVGRRSAGVGLVRRF